MPLSSFLAFVFVCLTVPAQASDYVADNGTVTLDSSVTTEIGTIRGVWEVYVGEALTPVEIESLERRRYAAVPPRYGRFYTAEGGRFRMGAITVRLAFVNVPRSSLTAIRIPSTYGRFRVWVNGNPIDTGNREEGVNLLPYDSPPHAGSDIVVPLFPDREGTAVVTAQLESFGTSVGGLAVRPAEIGPFREMIRQKVGDVFRDGLLIGALLLLAVHHLLVSLGPHRTIPAFSLAILFVAIAGRLFVVEGEMVLTTWPLVPPSVYTKLYGLVVYPIVPLYIRFVRRMYPLDAHHHSGRVLERISWAWLIASLLLPAAWWMDIRYAFVTVVVVAFGWVVGVIQRGIKARRKGIILTTVAITALLVPTIAQLSLRAVAADTGVPLASYGWLIFAGCSSFSVFQRIVDFRITLSTLREQAQRDGLTGLVNRRTLDDRLQEEWSRHSRTGKPLSLLMIDVDFFKSYNDTYGHQAGDRVLRRIAGVIHDYAKRFEDVAGRYGGEEFAVVLPNTDAKSAYAIAERIRQAVLDLSISHPEGPFGLVTVSIGSTAVFPSAGADPTDDGTADAPIHSLYNAADNALYDAKTSGRNAVRTSVFE